MSKTVLILSFARGSELMNFLGLSQSAANAQSKANRRGRPVLLGVRRGLFRFCDQFSERSQGLFDHDVFVLVHGAPDETFPLRYERTPVERSKSCLRWAIVPRLCFLKLSYLEDSLAYLNTRLNLRIGSETTSSLLGKGDRRIRTISRRW